MNGERLSHKGAATSVLLPATALASFLASLVISLLRFALQALASHRIPCLTSISLSHISRAILSVFQHVLR